MKEKHKDARARVANEDALFMVTVRPKDESNATSTDDAKIFTILMPENAVTLVDERGGMGAVKPSRVQLLTKSRVSVALFSHTLLAEEIVDRFIAARDAHLDDPKARAKALKDMLAELHAADHVFSFAVFDDSARAFAAWTPRGAPLSFGHREDGSVVVVANQPRSRTLVGTHHGVKLAHLPAGRFIYGHSFLKPFEFTSMWASAEANRGGAAAQTAPASPTLGAIDNLDKPKLSPVESRDWRWAKTGSRAEVEDRWTTKKTPRSVVMNAAVAEKENVVVEKKFCPKEIAATIAAIAEEVAAESALQADAPIFSPLHADAPAFAPVSPELAAKARETFAWGAVLLRNMVNERAVNRFTTRADKKFITVLLMRAAAFTPLSSSSEERAKALADALLSAKDSEVDSTVVTAPAASIATATTKGLAHAVQSTTREITKKLVKKQSSRTSALALPAKRATVAVGNGGGESSVVVCDLNGRCCVGNQCFV